MLPPRAEMEKLEDDILKQVNTHQFPSHHNHIPSMR
jgi:hypothetical protein